MTSIGRPEVPRPVSLGWFDLDDVGPVGTEQHGAIGRRDTLSKIEHAQTAIRRVVRGRYLACNCHLFSRPAAEATARGSADGCCRWLSVLRYRMCRRSGPCR